MKQLLTTAKKVQTRLLTIAVLRSSIIVCFYWSAVSIPFVLLKQYRILKLSPLFFLPVLIIALGINLFIQYRKKPDLRTSIVTADERAGLKARLITGYDQMEKKWENSYTDLIKKDIEKYINNVKIETQFPFKPPKYSLVLPLLMLIIIPLTIFQLPSNWLFRIDSAIADQSNALSDAANQLLEENKDNPDTNILELAIALEELAREFENSPISKKEAVEKLKELQNEIENNMSIKSLEIDLPELPSSLEQNINNALNKMQDNELSPSEMNDLNEMIMNSEDIKPEIKSELEELMEEFELNPDETFQRELAEKMKDVLEQNNESLTPEMQEDATLMENLKKISETLAKDEGGMATEGGKRTDMDEGTEHANAQGNKTSDIAGKTDSADNPNEFSKQGDVNETTQKVDDRKTNEDVIQLKTKNLPEYQEYDTDIQNIDIDYKKAAEANIIKEDIPASMKEYLKDYFTGIGMYNSRPENEGDNE